MKSAAHGTAVLYCGSISRMTMKTTQMIAIQLMIGPHVLLSTHGPGLNALGLMRRRNTGVR